MPLDSKGRYYFVGSGGGGGGGYGITLNEDSKFSYLYVLGLLNSRLLRCLLESPSARHSEVATSPSNRQYIEQLPIRPINSADPANVPRHA